MVLSGYSTISQSTVISVTSFVAEILLHAIFEKYGISKARSGITRTAGYPILNGPGKLNGNDSTAAVVRSADTVRRNLAESNLLREFYRQLACSSRAAAVIEYERERLTSNYTVTYTITVTIIDRSRYSGHII